MITDSNKQLRGIYTIVNPVNVGDGKNCSNLESIDGSKVTSWQYRVGTDMVPQYPVTNLADSYTCALDSFRRANVKNDDYPLTYGKYTTGRCYFTGIDLEKSKTTDSECFSGIDSNGINISFNMTMSSQADSAATCGAIAATAASNGLVSGVNVNHFLHHDRLLTITADKSVVLDY